MILVPVARSFRAFARDGRLHLTAPVAYRQHCANYGDGEEIVIVVKRAPKRQGNALMRYYRGVVVPDIATATGVIDPDDYEAVHDALAWKFLKIADHPLFGTPRRRSTSKDDMDATEMQAYVDQVITYAETEIVGCRIRRPDDVDEDAIPDYSWSAA